MKAVGLKLLLVWTIIGVGCKPHEDASKAQSLENFTASASQDHISMDTCTPDPDRGVSEEHYAVWKKAGTLNVNQTSLKPLVQNLLGDAQGAVQLMYDAGYEIHITAAAAQQCQNLAGIAGRDLSITDTSGKTYVACYRSLYSRPGETHVLTTEQLKQVDGSSLLEERLAVYIEDQPQTIREQLLRTVGYAVFGRIVDFSDQGETRTLQVPGSELWSLMVQLAGEVMRTQMGQPDPFGNYPDLRPENFSTWTPENFTSRYNGWIEAEKTQIIAGQFIRYLAAEAYQNYTQCGASRDALKTKFSEKVLDLMGQLNGELAATAGITEGSLQLFGGRLIANRIRARRANRANGIYGLRNAIAPQVVARNHGVSYAHRGLDWQWRNGSQMGAYGQGYGGYYTNHYSGNRGYTRYQPRQVYYYGLQ